MVKIDLKPLSVNQAYRGRRFNTKEKVNFEKAALMMLPALGLKLGPRLEVGFLFGFSNKGQDVDGPIKVCLDVLQKRYGFNDNKVYRLSAEKVIVPKGQEFWAFTIANTP
jgi:Holliday junction resolvase RusA-like endonuclease